MAFLLSCLFQSAYQGLYDLPSTNFLDSFLSTLHPLHSLTTVLAAVLALQHAGTLPFPLPFAQNTCPLRYSQGSVSYCLRSMFKLQFVKHPVLNDLNKKMLLTILSLYSLLYLCSNSSLLNILC